MSNIISKIIIEIAAWVAVIAVYTWVRRAVSKEAPTTRFGYDVAQNTKKLVVWVMRLLAKLWAWVKTKVLGFVEQRRDATAPVAAAASRDDTPTPTVEDDDPAVFVFDEDDEW